ncbi:protein CutA 1, chloroplastic [Neltuma alba]|uniref:protein CutA 1, chloroplastic n=1 Tax=Neltuma alba TaxID=207710 RepID=UPI0010A38916|nr:protein CutA 1, chloroplastic-like [Prosopis alba]
MPSPVRSQPSFLSPSTLRRRLPLIGAVCIFAFASSAFYSSLTNSRSKFGGQSPATGMEGSTSTVPSIVVYVTVPSKEAGKKLAESIVKEKLAACVNRVPGIESVYQWKGEIQTDSEELLIIKTRQSLLEALTEHVKANHEYETPEVISLPIAGGNLKYLEWIKDSTQD